MKFQTQYDMEPRKPEKNSGISRTIPDHALTIKQIMERHTIGQPIEQRDGRYHDETGEDEEAVGFETGEIMEKLDYADIQERAESLAARQEERNATELKDKKQKQKEQLKKIFEKHEEELKAKWKSENQGGDHPTQSK